MQIRSIASKQVGPSEQVLLVQEWVYYFGYVNGFVFRQSYVKFLLQLCGTLVFLTGVFFHFVFPQGEGTRLHFRPKLLCSCCFSMGFQSFNRYTSLQRTFFGPESWFKLTKSLCNYSFIPVCKRTISFPRFQYCLCRICYGKCFSMVTRALVFSMSKFVHWVKLKVQAWWLSKHGHNNLNLPSLNWKAPCFLIKITLTNVKLTCCAVDSICSEHHDKSRSSYFHFESQRLQLCCRALIAYGFWN